MVSINSSFDWNGISSVTRCPASPFCWVCLASSTLSLFWGKYGLSYLRRIPLFTLLKLYRKMMRSGMGFQQLMRITGATKEAWTFPPPLKTEGLYWCILTLMWGMLTSLRLLALVSSRKRLNIWQFVGLLVDFISKRDKGTSRVHILFCTGALFDWLWNDFASWCFTQSSEFLGNQTPSHRVAQESRALINKNSIRPLNNQQYNVLFTGNA